MLADLIVFLHFLFVLFVVVGGFLAIRWSWVSWVHIPSVLWGVLIEYGGWICPLTPLENRFRAEQGSTTYESDFIAQYILPILYPEGLTRRDQLTLGTFALVLNIAIYAFIFLRHRRSVSKDI